MTIFVTGGTGKTSSRLAALLDSTETSYLVASRRGPSASSTHPVVAFDFTQPSTYSAPFEWAKENGSSAISAVYLVAPGAQEASDHMNAFMDYALKEHGVKRFVMCTGSLAQPGGPIFGGTWNRFLELEKSDGVGWCVLKPVWFFENLSEESHQYTISNSNTIHSATGTSQVPFVDAEDIAAVAHRALTDAKPHNTDHWIMGSTKPTYDEVAALISTHLGRTITHKQLSPDERTQGLIGMGVAAPMAGFLTYLEGEAQHTSDLVTSEDVEKVLGRKPLAMEDFVKAQVAAGKWKEGTGTLDGITL